MGERSGLRPELAAMLAAAEARGDPPLAELDVEAARAAMANDCNVFWGPVEAVAHVEDGLVAGPAGPVPVRLYRPGAGVLPGLVYLHGGGWVVGGIETHDGLCRALANEAGAVVMSVGYRLAPEHPFPAAPDDVAAAVRWLFGEAWALGVDRERISVAGDSAGGNLAAVVARSGAREGLSLASQVLIYPVTDTVTNTASYRANGEGFLLSQADMDWYLDHYLPADLDRGDPRCAPLRADDLADLPSAYVATCELDPLRDDGLSYAWRLREAGVTVEAVDWAGLIHGVVMMRTITPAADELRRRVVAFLRGTWGPGRR